MAGFIFFYSTRYLCLLLPKTDLPIVEYSSIQLLEELQSQTVLGSDRVTRRKGCWLQLEGSRSDI